MADDHRLQHLSAKEFPMKRQAIRLRVRLLGFISALALPAFALGGCGEPTQAAPKPPTVVRVQAAKVTALAASVTLTGHIAARVESDLGFRIEGRIASRNVDVGDHVKMGQILATLETTKQLADVNAAKAGVASAEATLTEAQTTFRRQSKLLAQGFTTRPEYDRAKQALDGAMGGLDRARAELGTAEDTLVNTKLRAEADGVVTARYAEAGQVVGVAQKVYTVAQDGPRDAVFEVFEALLVDPPAERPVELTLISDPSIKAIGVVREVAPTVDATKGTVRVKIGINNPPPEMGLAAPVSGVARFKPQDAVVLPWTAFFTEDGKPAVWVVDAQTKAVSLRRVEVDTYRTGALVLSAGLRDGELVVIQGGQWLRPGEIVAPQGDAPDALGVKS
jgi:RND family efflux transporter MFP subunit